MSIASNLSALIATFTRKAQDQFSTNADILNVSRNLQEVYESSASGVEGLTTQVNSIDTSLSVKQLNCVEVNYNFAEDGGTVGEILTGVTIPANSIITKVYFKTLTAPTSAANTGELTLILSGSLDLTSPIIADGTAIGITDGVPTWAAATMIETEATARELAFDIAVEDITAGEVVFFVIYNTYS